jgi:hypothetical protein
MKTQDEFNEIAAAMEAEGTPLTLANLLIRTELPKHRIKDFLKEYRNPTPKPIDPLEAPVPPVEILPLADSKLTLVGKGVTAIGGIVSGATFGVAGAAKGLKDRVFTRKDETDDKEAEVDENAPQADDEDTFDFIFRPAKRNVGVGMAVGFIGGPLGFFYSAPWVVAIASTLAYFAVAVALYHVPVVGKTTLLPYVLSVTHLVCAFASGYFSWQFNRNGLSRDPAPTKKSKKSKK